MPKGLIEFCERARERIAAAQQILLVSHIFPEADSVGSESAMARHLSGLGKAVCVCNPTEVQEIYQFLIDLSGIPREAWCVGHQQIPEHDLIIILDVSNWDYMGRLGDVLQQSSVLKICFDHHHSATPIDELALIDTDASATGAVLYRYFLATGAKIDTPMASALYASILFDTGGFRFRNTRDETLLIACELIRRGASHTETAARLFENESFSRVELLTAALSRVVSDPKGRMAWTYVTRDMFARTGTTTVDADGIIDNLMTIRGVELAVVFREILSTEVKVTFRSKGEPDVGLLAERLGGGGRPTASGVTIQGSLKEAISTVLARVSAELELDGERRRKGRGDE
ncbi:MAG: bifunctional oligoribonuclease/PAP phosphatase NrnA [Candidatus Eisenbacteria sp.]|nr:bifunctional oligoribonuclease/PAP phosphatase NrnA [Candidatus Eisenbacteria bacterium]